MEQVSHTIAAAELNPQYEVYAHALFCARAEFRRHYADCIHGTSFNKLRVEVSDRHFGNVVDFDAANIIDAVRRLEIKQRFYESGVGFFGASN